MGLNWMSVLKFYVIAALTILSTFSISYNLALGDDDANWLNCSNIDSNDPLHAAVRANDVSSVKCLLEGGFNPNALDSHGYAALPTSIGVDVKITSLLLEYKADVNISNAAALGHAIRILGEFIEARNSGADGSDVFDTYPLESSLEDKINWGKVTLYKLLDYGADYNLLANSDRYDKEHSTLISFVFSLCEAENKSYYKYMDFKGYFYEITSRSKQDIKFTDYDLSGLKHLETLSEHGLYNKECLESSRTYFQKNVA